MRLCLTITTHLAPQWRRFRACLVLLIASCGVFLGGVGCGGNVDNGKFRDGHGGVKGQLFLEDGSPAALAHIQVVNLPSIKTTTDTEGRFQLNDVPAGRRELVLTHAKPFAARVSVWVVHRFSVTLTDSLSILKPVASLVGRISARPRLDAKGIEVIVKGLPYTTKTYNDQGDFRFPSLPEGCHVLQVSSAYFSRKEIPNICVTSKQTTTLPESIALAPAVPCQSNAPRCVSGGLCVEGFCVPDPGGTALLLAGGEQSLGEVLFAEKKQEHREILRNVGPGQLRILRVELKDPEGLFSIQLPQLPLVLQKGDSLSATLILTGTTLGDHHALLQIETNAKEESQYQVRLTGRVQPHPSHCLSATPGIMELGELQADQPKIFELTVSNRCGQTLLLEAGKENDTKQAMCGASWLGQFSMNVCVTLVQKLPIKVPPGLSVKLQLQIIPQAYGVLTGEITLPHDETPGGRLQIPVRGWVNAPQFTISRQPLDFGDVAPDEQRTLWLALRSEKPLSQEEIQGLSLQVDASGAAFFQALASRIARLPDDSRLIYLPIALKTPVAGRLLAGTLRIGGLPGLNQRDLLVSLKARIASPLAPNVPAALQLGATDGCQPPAQPLQLHNPSDKDVVVTQIAWPSGAPVDFSLQASLPVTIPAYRTVTIAQVQFVPTAKAMRAFGQLKVTSTYGDNLEAQHVVALQAATGYPLQESFAQANGPNVDILLYIDQDIDQTRTLPQLEAGITTLLTGLNAQKINYRLLPIVAGDNSDIGISPLTPNPITELRRLLRPATDPEHAGLAQLYRMLQRRNAPANTVTAVIFVAREDDRSPHTINRYLPASSETPFVVFAALPHSQCAAPTTRYEEAVRRTGGAILDLCIAQPGTWQLWGERIQRLAIGERILFPLSSTPKGTNASTIQLSTPQHKLPPEQWKYDPENNEISLGHPAFLPRGQTLTVSYYTQCQ